MKNKIEKKDMNNSNSKNQSSDNSVKWYEFHPSDTLFLRGSEPMVSGISYETTQLFPPPVSVISGAIRTAVLAQKNISIQKYKNGDPIKELIGEYGKHGDNLPFKVVGPFLKVGDDYFVPAPYTWFVDEDKSGKKEKSENKNESKNDSEKSDDESSKKITVLEATPLDSQVVNSLGLKSSSRIPGWVKHKNEIKTVGGSWVSLSAMLNGDLKFKDGDTIFNSKKETSKLFFREERIGIKFDSNRVVEESKLYMSRHIRLKSGVSLVWGIDRDCSLEDQGVISIGGEQRFGSYRAMQPKLNLSESSTRNQYLALSPVEVNKINSEALIASGKIVYRGGWDIAKQFHKDMKGYFPAGSVFSSRVDSSSIAI